MMVPVLFWLGGSAWALPTKVAHTIEVGTSVADVVVAEDGTTVAIVDDATGQLFLLDLASWDLVSTSPCTSVTSVAAWGDHAFYAGCTDGTLVWVSFEDGAVTAADDAVALTESSILGVTTNDNFVFAIAEHADNGNPQVHSYDPESGSVATTGYPTTLGYSGFSDIESNNSYVFVSHGGSSMSKVDIGSGAATIQQSAPGSAKTHDVVTIGASKVFVAGGPAGVLEFEYSTNRLTLFLTAEAGVESATALAAVDDEEFFAVADDDQELMLLFDLDASVGVPSGPEIGAVDLPAGNAAVNEIGVLEGYLLAGTDNGAIWVLTDRPWVDAEDAVPSAAINGTEVSIAFTSDTAGSWSARVGASTNTDGKQVASGTVSAGDADTVSLTVDSSFAEGDNPVRIVVTDDDGNKGHDTAYVNVDNPPSQVKLKSSDAGFGDQMVTIDLNGIDDEDLTHYMVYVTTIAFTADDYPTGGPDFVGAAEDASASKIGVPKNVSASPGQDKQIKIKPLTNGVSYYVAVRAYDEAGQEGPMSKVVTATPRETFSAAELANESGGMQCGSADGAAAGLLALLGGLLVGFRRRSSGVAVVAAICMAIPSSAQASEWPQSGKTFEDFTGSTFEVRYGPLSLSDDNIATVFGSKGNNIFWLEVGPTFFDLIELTASMGYWRDTGQLVSASGAKSSQEDVLMVVPFTTDATLRLDVLPEQFIVPFIGGGMDYWFWRESWEAGGSGSGGSLGGGKSGLHTSYGASVLLDLFQPGRASKLEAKTGITDTFITVEWREQVIGEDQGGLQFSGDVLTIGLKLDY